RADQEEAVRQRDIADRERQIAIEQRAKAEKARDRTRDVLDAMTSEVTGDSLSTQKAISADQKKFLTEVLTYYREFAGEKADDEHSRADTARGQNSLGKLEDELGKQKEADAPYRIARDVLERLAADSTAVPDCRQDLALSQFNL